MLTQQEYNEIIDCIKYGAPASVVRLISAINNLIKEASENTITKTEVTNKEEGEE